MKTAKIVRKIELTLTNLYADQLEHVTEDLETLFTEAEIIVVIGDKEALKSSFDDSELDDSESGEEIEWDIRDAVLCVVDTVNWIDNPAIATWIKSELGRPLSIKIQDLGYLSDIAKESVIQSLKEHGFKSAEFVEADVYGKDQVEVALNGPVQDFEKIGHIREMVFAMMKTAMLVEHAYKNQQPSA